VNKIKYRGYINPISTNDLKKLVATGFTFKNTDLYHTDEKNCYMLYHSNFKDPKGYNRILKPVRIWDKNNKPYIREFFKDE